MLAEVGTRDTGLTWGDIEDLITDMGWELLDWTAIEQSEAGLDARERLLPVVDAMEEWYLALSSMTTAWDEFWAKSQEWNVVLDGAGEVRRTLDEAASLLGDYGYAVELGT